MARKPRLHIPGASYHVILRGNARDDIFFADEDRYRFYLLLQEGVERFGHRIHAFCLMTNHVHLAVQVGEVPLSKIMQNVSFRYTRWVNWRQNRTGHLFQGRHKAYLVDTDEYLLQLVRYIHLNPIRVGLAKSPADYPWSSHLAYLGKHDHPWLATDWTLSHFAATIGKARQGFARFVTDGIGEAHRPEFHGHGMADSRFIGEERFVEQALIKAENSPERRYSVREIITAVCEVYGVGEERIRLGGRLSAEIRGVAALLSLELPGTGLVHLAPEVARDATSLSSAARRVADRAREDDALFHKIEMLRHDFASLQA
jgi:REP element-mobilizing transposase RayT